MVCASSLILNPGSDYRSTAIVTDDNGDAVDLTGYTAEVLDGTGDLVSGVAFSITDAAAGECALEITWGDWSLDLARVIGTARLRLTNGSTQTASVPIEVRTPLAADKMIVPRGGDTTWQFTWPDDSEGADLAGQTIEVFNASTALSGRVSISVVNAATRLVEATIEGVPSLAVGSAGTVSFRRSTAGSDRRTILPIEVIVK